jgi:hypothetical protein
MCWFVLELIVKTPLRKESDFEMPGLMDPNENDRPVTEPRELSKLPPTRFGGAEPFSKNAGSSHNMTRTAVFEKHYSVKELADLWNLSDRTVRRMFSEEPGVVQWGTGERLTKRAYKTLRIPESVVRRVHGKLRKAS